MYSKYIGNEICHHLILYPWNAHYISLGWHSDILNNNIFFHYSTKIINNIQILFLNVMVYKNEHLRGFQFRAKSQKLFCYTDT